MAVQSNGGGFSLYVMCRGGKICPTNVFSTHASPALKINSAGRAPSALASRIFVARDGSSETPCLRCEVAERHALSSELL
jgi:hypothetical protein